MNALVQRSFRTVFGSFPQDPVVLDVGASSAWRMLRAFFLLNASPLSSAVIPLIRHVGSGGQILGEWIGCGNDGNAFDVTAGILRVTISTASSPGLAANIVNAPNDGTSLFCRIPIPPDLIVLDNETLEVHLLGASTNTLIGSEIFWTAVMEPA